MPRPPKYDHDEILDRAVRTFWRQGWSATSIRELEGELDLRAPSIYRRFGSKDGLARAVLQRYVDRVLGGRVERHLSGDGDPLDGIWGFLGSSVEQRSPDVPLVGCLLTATATEYPALAADLDDVMADGFARIDAALLRELSRAESEGRLRPGLGAREAAIAVGLGFQGLMVHARRGRPAAELLADAEVLLRSVAPGWTPSAA